MDRAFVLLFGCAGDIFDQCVFDKSVYTYDARMKVIQAAA